MPRVSVIVPVHNVEKYIKKCAYSLFEQTFDDIEYLFVDDCSTDRSIDVLQEAVKEFGVEHKVKILHHDRNRGISAARNTGLKYAGGDYIGWVDADDWVEKDLFEELYQNIVTYGYDFLFCGYTEDAKDGSCTKKIGNYNGARERSDHINALLSGEIDAYLWNKLIKRDLFDAHTIRCLEGYDMWEDFTLLAQVVYYAQSIGRIETASYHHLLRAHSYSCIGSKKQALSMVNNIMAVDAFLKSVGVSCQPIMGYKLAAKKAFLPFTVDIETWRNLFPETHSHIWHQCGTPLYLKIFEWCLIKHLDFCYPLYKGYLLIKSSLH